MSVNEIDIQLIEFPKDSHECVKFSVVRQIYKSDKIIFSIVLLINIFLYTLGHFDE